MANFTAPTVTNAPISTQRARREGLGPRSRLLLRRQPRAEEHQRAALRGPGHRLHRPVRLRQVHAAARPEPHVRPLSRTSAPPAKCMLDGENILSPTQDLNLLRAKVGMVFQKPTPFPMTIYENIAFGIRLYEKLPKSELDARVEHGAAAARRSGTRSRTSSTPAACRSPAASSSACASPAPWRCSPRSSCSTSPARRSIRSRPPRSRS